MLHLGDITKIKGCSAPVVDCIIGGFPYIWEQLNGNGSCLWASEIEEFPMAVTKIRFAQNH